MKSLAASIALPAWLLGHNPALSIVNVTCGQDLSDKFARDCRAVMTSEWYQMLFATRLSSDRPPFQELATTAGGFRLATSVGGALTGRGADVVIIDDPIKPSDALSESRRAGANEWFDATLYSRLNDKTKGAIVIVMQRLHENDLVGHVLKRENWDRLSFPAIAEDDEAHVVETIYGAKEYRREAGEALHPGRESLETLGRIRTMIGEYNFAGQYQQRPAPSGGGMVKAAWLRRYARDERPAFDRIVQSWDTANKPSELADYSVCTTWGVKGLDFYLLNVFRKKLGFPELKRAVAEQNELFRPQTILIEDKASGTQLIQELIASGLSHVQGVKPDGDKIMRLHAADGADRERLRPSAGRGALARRLPRRGHRVSGFPARRPGRLDRAVPRLGEEEAPSAVVHRHDEPLWGAGVEGGAGLLGALRSGGAASRPFSPLAGRRLG